MSSLSRIPSLSSNNRASKESKEKKKRWALDCVQTLFIQGKRQNAIDLAMEHELWAHSMLIASITDDSSYQDVIRAFAASLPAESPLRMLYSQIVGEDAKSVSAEDDATSWYVVFSNVGDSLNVFQSSLECYENSDTNSDTNARTQVRQSSCGA